MQKTIAHPMCVLETRRYPLPGFAGLLVECDFSIDAHGLDAVPAALGQAVPKRRAEFLAGRWCAHLAMEQLGVAPVEVGIGKDRAPIWPPQVRGSITHTGATGGEPAVACCALAFAGDYRGIGIDIENIMSEVTAAETASLVVDEQERKFLLQQDAAWAYLVTLVFSAKESLFKALYPAVGRYFDFTDVRLVALDLAAGSFSVELKVSLASSLPAGWQVEGRFLARGSRLLTMVYY